MISFLRFKINLIFPLLCIAFSYAQQPIENGFALLEKGAFSEAETFFEAYLKEKPDHKTAKLCYGRAVGLNGNPEKAMQLFNELLADDAENLEYLLNQTECLLWQKKFDEALIAYKKLEETYPDNAIVQLGLGNTLSNLKVFKTSINHYLKAIDQNEKILGSYIGLANTYFAYNQDRLALNTIDNAFKIDSTHQGLKKLKQRILNKYIPSLTNKTSITNDSGDNDSFISDNTLEVPLSTRLALRGNHFYKSSTNKIKDVNSSLHTFQAGLSYKVTNKITSTTDAGIIRASGYNGNYVNWIGTTNLEIKPNTRHQINVGYKKEYHNFNADLIDLEIAMHHLYLNYHHLTKLNVGVFTQYYYTLQSDQNRRSLWFTSLYYLWREQPAFKTGVNYLNIAFKDQIPENYFSPEMFNSVEVFADFNYDIANKPWYGNAQVAYGYQFVKGDKEQSTFRGNAGFGYKFSPYFKLSVFGQYSNLAAGNAAGFSFNEFGIKFKYKFKNHTFVK